MANIRMIRSLPLMMKYPPNSCDDKQHYCYAHTVNGSIPIGALRYTVPQPPRDVERALVEKDHVDGNVLTKRKEIK